MYFDIELITLADYIMNTVYQDDGVNGLYYHDGQGSYTNADQEAGDNSYRYAGADPNNYVCFGSNAEVCPEDNLYRIIGVFDGQVKLIKNDYANSDLLGINGDYYIDKNGISLYYWNNSSAPKVSWDESNLNNVNLNVNFFNSFDSFWQKFILYRQWYQSYFPAIFGDTAVQDFLSYQQKKGMYERNIGLLSIIDYAYSTSPSNWLISLNSYSSNVNDNWLYSGLEEWTIDELQNTGVGHGSAGCISSNGNIDVAFVGNFYYDGFGANISGKYLAVRPTFYLDNNVKLSKGNGTEDNPYRLSV